ncbi:MAG: hypothetical protein ACK6CO_09575 [Cyanobacteriota bacterium]
MTQTNNAIHLSRARGVTDSCFGLLRPGDSKASGAGWQARMDAVLKDYVQAHSTGDAKGA